MLKLFISFLLATQAVFILSCSATKSISKHPLTGSEMSTEWIEYNKQAAQTNSPKLVYLATCKKVGGPSGKKKAVDITDHFSLKDERFYVFCQWKNIFGKHVFKLKVFDPRGVLFKNWDCLYSYSDTTWKLWSYEFIENAPAARIPGKWTAEIYMDDKLAAKKTFTIGSSSSTHSKVVYTQNTPAIAVAKFIYKGDGGHRFGTNLPDYIAQMLTIEYPNCRVILPSEVMKFLSLSQIESIENSTDNIINSPLLDDFFGRKNIKLLIIGSVYDDGLVGETKTFKVNIIDAKNRTVVCETKTLWSSLHNYKYNPDQLIMHGSQSVFKKISKEGKRYFESLF